jgi:SAM-dependent methyltransferase
MISILRSCLPAGIRRLRVLQRTKNVLNDRLLGHDGVYNAQYYELFEAPVTKGAPVMCASILTAFHPATLIDVGCGTGALMRAFRERGVLVAGLEYSDAALAFCRERQLNVRKFDLEKDLLTTGERFDVAVSMEVAEHLPAGVASQYVALLAKLSDVIVFSAAPPGQGGQDHVNEQPPSYWISRFAAHGLIHDESTTNAWKHEWRTSGLVAPWYSDNLLLFRRI